MMLRTFIFVLLFPALSFAQSDIVSRLQTNGVATKLPSGEYLVPVRATVRNAGNDIAGRFKIHFEWSHPTVAGTKLTTLKGLTSADGAFVADGAFYVWTNRAMFVGNSFSFNTSVVLPKNLPAKTRVSIRAVGDSCSGDELMPFFCRIDELREDNNRSEMVTATLPL